ncbi:protein MULTIPLE CHLOROPLAST DIVISION SITE 1 [Cornus florida]|uniref:protein MULTIPLE CHLOROPLAST DIVISION SITE 1 n=1 Tax=Cornus florida TaxID=4283 RepID=UPI00289A066F|nr:protein MULTIPLE CHLOROPLAST DIVISION SITE 1 [Cornus florida]XP_059636501.1 protein MULTIPLE CHLOROPLAST DIVISION SITE 1 [Cornus florida]
MASIWTLQLHTVSFPRRFPPNVLEIRTLLGFNCGYLNRNRRKTCRKFVLRASSDSVSSGADKRVEDEVVIETKRDKLVGFKNRVERLQQTIGSLPHIILVKKSHSGTSFAIGICVLATMLAIAVRVHALRKSRSNRPGTVADLVRRGQLRSDRRGISTPLKYEDPFNNPMVKVGKSNSTVEMCGKVYRLVPVTLTKEQQAIHQKRRSRAYQWKRPTLFLREGDSVPPDVDLDTIRWIPANHPFATTASDIDEDLAQNNVYQKHGVPFRIQAEHEALQKKLEALQNEQKFNKLFIDPGAVKEFERPFKSNLRPDEHVEPSPSNGDVGSKPSKSDHAPSSFKSSNSTYEETQKP